MLLLPAALANVSARRTHLPFFETPNPIISSGDRSLLNTTHPRLLRPAAGHFAAAPGFLPQAIRSPARFFRARREADTALGFASLRSLDTGTSRRVRAAARKLCPFRQP